MGVVLLNPGDDFVGQGSARTVLGGGKVAKRVTSIQVRLFAPNLGVFKGILAQKRGIEHVQLPPSMRKVPPKVTKREAAQFAARNMTASCGLATGRPCQRRLGPGCEATHLLLHLSIVLTMPSSTSSIRLLQA